MLALESSRTCSFSFGVLCVCLCVSLTLFYRDHVVLSSHLITGVTIHHNGVPKRDGRFNLWWVQSIVDDGSLYKERWTPFVSLLEFMDWLFFSPFGLLFCTAKAEEVVITSTCILSRYGAEWKIVSFTPVSSHPVSFTPTRLGVWNMNETLSKHFLWFMARLQLPSSYVCQTKSVRVQSPARWWWLRVGS